MKITQEVREFAAKQELNVLDAADVEAGLKQKAEEFVASGSKLYSEE
jgi:phosphomethylpyrimidine synthase